MNNNPLQVNILRFIGICLLAFIFITAMPDAVFAPLNSATAHLSGLFLAHFVSHAEVVGDMISLEGFRVRIITECTALNAAVLFGAVVCSSPASMKARVAGLISGVLFLNTANILRIALVTAIGAGYPALFEGVHVYLTQTVMVILVVAVSLLWLRWANRSDDGVGPFLLRSALLASALFPLWLLINTAYVGLMDSLVSGVFALTGYRLFFAADHLVYFQTFNVVIFVALVFAEQRLSLRSRILWAVLGTEILAAGHLMFRIGNVLLIAFAWHPALPLTHFLNLIGEYLLPVLLWITATRSIKTIKE